MYTGRSYGAITPIYHEEVAHKVKGCRFRVRAITRSAPTFFPLLRMTMQNMQVLVIHFSRSALTPSLDLLAQRTKKHYKFCSLDANVNYDILAKYGKIQLHYVHLHSLI